MVLSPDNDPVTSFQVQDNDMESQFRGSSKSKGKKFKKKVKKMKKKVVVIDEDPIIDDDFWSTLYKY